MNAAKKRYERLKASGRCVNCPATAAGGVYCLSCAAKNKQRRGGEISVGAVPFLRPASVLDCPR